MTADKKARLKKIPHIIAALVTGLHAWERFEHGNSNYLFFAIAAVIFALVVLFHKRLVKIFPAIDIVFFLLEAMLAGVIAYEYAAEHKTKLSVAYIVAGLMQLAGIFIARSRNKLSGH